MQIAKSQSPLNQIRFLSAGESHPRCQIEDSSVITIIIAESYVDVSLGSVE